MSIFANKEIFEDGTWISLQIPMDENDPDSPCRALSFEEHMVNDAIAALTVARDSEGKDYTKDEEYLKNKAEYEEQNEKDNVWYKRLYAFLLEDIGIQVTPFYWKWRLKEPKFMSKWVDGFQIGPISFTWNHEWGSDHRREMREKRRNERRARKEAKG